MRNLLFLTIFFCASMAGASDLVNKFWNEIFNDGASLTRTQSPQDNRFTPSPMSPPDFYYSDGIFAGRAPLQIQPRISSTIEKKSGEEFYGFPLLETYQNKTQLVLRRLRGKVPEDIGQAKNLEFIKLCGRPEGNIPLAISKLKNVFFSAIKGQYFRSLVLPSFEHDKYYLSADIAGNPFRTVAPYMGTAPVNFLPHKDPTAARSHLHPLQDSVQIHMDVDVLYKDYDVWHALHNLTQINFRGEKLYVAFVDGAYIASQINSDVDKRPLYNDHMARFEIYSNTIKISHINPSVLERLGISKKDFEVYVNDAAFQKCAPESLTKAVANR